MGLVYFLSLFLCILIHEFAHSITAASFGIRTESITLLPIGGIARLERLPDRAGQELAIAIAGPAINVIIAALLFVALKVSDSWLPIKEITLINGPLLERLFFANLCLAFFNLLPAFPMDGGRILRALLALVTTHRRATKVAVFLGRVLSVVMAVLGFFGDPMLFLVALFVWASALQEAHLSESQAVLHGITVRQAMLTDFHTLLPGDNLRRAADIILQGSEEDFIVMDEAKSVVGVLTRKGLLAALSQNGPDEFVENAMTHSFTCVKPDTLVETIVTEMSQTEATLAPVLEGHRLIGVLNMENISELVMLRQAVIDSRSINPSQSAS
jgi:Zn-dependent protease